MLQLQFNQIYIIHHYNVVNDIDYSGFIEVILHYPIHYHPWDILAVLP